MRKTIYLLVFLSLFACNAESRVVSGNLSTEFSSISFFNAMSQKECDKINASYLKDIYGSVEAAYGKSCGYCCDWIYPYPIPLEGDQYVITHRLDFYPSLILRSGNNVLSDGDTYCEGDLVEAEYNIKGDWIRDGGPVDCPAIQWVDPVNFENIIKKYLAVHKGQDYDTGTFTINHSMNYSYDYTDWMIHDPVSDIDAYYTVGVRNCFPVLYGNIVCTPGIKKEFPSQEYNVSSWYSGVMKFNLSYSPKCMLVNPVIPVYYYDYDIEQVYPAFDYRIFINPTGWDCSLEQYHVGQCDPLKSLKLSEDTWLNYIAKATEINLSAQITGVTESRRPRIEVIKSTAGKDHGDYIVRSIIANKGDAKAFINGVSLNLNTYTVLYYPKTLDAGQISDVLIQTDGDSLFYLKEPLKLYVDYRSEKLTCLRERDFSDNLSLEVTELIVPDKTSEVYRMDVAEGCTNQYYSCYSPDKDGWLSSGYSCFNRDPYYVDTKKRIDLGYKLPAVPNGTRLLYAGVRMEFSGIDKAQEVSIHAGIGDWQKANCVAGGDLCEKPYCSECAGLYDLGGPVISSAYANGPGTYLLDVTDWVKEKQTVGANYVSFQLRGSEDVWSREGKASCGKFKEWKDSVVTTNAIKSRPVLELVYS